MIIKDIYDYIDSFAPFASMCEWDNSGILVGDLNKSVNRIGLALDADSAAIRAAAESGCDLLITHHPVIFKPLKNISFESRVSNALRSGLSILCAHTNLDKSAPGTNTALAELLGLSDDYFPDCDSDAAMCRIGYFKDEMNSLTLSKIISSRLNTVVKYADSGRLIKKIAVCGGAGGEFIYDPSLSDIDAFVTGEVKHHEFIDAKENGISIFSAGHYETEFPVIKMLKNKIETDLQAECVIVNDKAPADYYGE